VEFAVAKRKSSWSVADAKASLSELLGQATSSGPQTITRRGEPIAVVVSVEEWQRKSRRKGNLAEFFAASPLRDSGLELEERAIEPDRPLDL
jgi:prevent-host-death family protein